MVKSTVEPHARNVLNDWGGKRPDIVQKRVVANAGKLCHTDAESKILI